MVHLSNIIIPALIFYIIMTGLAQKKNIYQSFTKGAKDGVETVFGILPTLIGLMVAVGVLRASGFLEFLGKFLGRFLGNFPQELVSLFMVKIVSSSAATGLLLDIYKEYGTDSYAGLVASLAVSSTETVFYTMSVYFMAVKVTKTRWTLPGALISTMAGILASILLAKKM
ncbi:MAG: spore maturation protein [Lachnospiraceae bacterium]|nr:spore maturation protein [Lachnospiraceae bacterium]